MLAPTPSPEEFLTTRLPARRTQPDSPLLGSANVSELPTEFRRSGRQTRSDSSSHGAREINRPLLLPTIRKSCWWVVVPSLLNFYRQSAAEVPDKVEAPVHHPSPRALEANASLESSDTTHASEVAKNPVVDASGKKQVSFGRVSSVVDVEMASVDAPTRRSTRRSIATEGQAEADSPVPSRPASLTSKQTVADRPVSQNPDVGGDNNCCRNGRKRTSFGGSGKVASAKPRHVDGQNVDASEYNDGNVGSKRGRKPDDGGVEGEGKAKKAKGAKDKAEEVTEVAAKKAKRNKGKTAEVTEVAKGAKTVWMTDGSPPPTHDTVNHIVLSLAGIVSNDHAQRLVDLVSELCKSTRTTAVEADSLDLGSLIKQCHVFDRSVMLNDFQHMLLFIRLACNLNQ